MRTYRSVSVAALAIALSALAGGFYGGRVLAVQDGLPERYNVFTAALSQIDQKYVEKVESDRLVYGAINGMLQTLDPHSSFMDPKAYALLRERQEGHYYGLGISINVVDGDINAAASDTGSVPNIIESRYCTNSETTRVKMKYVSDGELRRRKVCRP